jgi:ATP-binding cassette subfamily B (MDR/TAP) protein 1
MGKAKHAAAQLKKLFDRKPTIDIWSTAGARIPPGSSDVKGDLVFKDVHFRYPTRPEQPVLRGLDLHIKPGQYVALVGSSGCGKSTTIGLLERFYDPLSGAIFLDGQDISKLNLADYRSHLALVSQEPTLYQGTIRENILLGADHSADIPEAEMDERIVQACKDANIHSFITSLPEGFNTSCGGKGVLLSGGTFHALRNIHFSY